MVMIQHKRGNSYIAEIVFYIFQSSLQPWKTLSCLWCLRIESHAQGTPGGYAIAGQDSDFLIMRGIQYMPMQFLKIEGEGKTVQVKGRIFTAASVADALHLPEHRLHELAWLVGNDFSADLLDKYDVANRLGIPTVSSKIKGNRCLPQDVAALRFFPEFLMVIVFGR